jgi:hypothetical protein
VRLADDTVMASTCPPTEIDAVNQAVEEPPVITKFVPKLMSQVAGVSTKVSVIGNAGSPIL